MNKIFPEGVLAGWRVQRNVIEALVYRELKTRVSEVRFGVLGVFIEPLGVMAVFLGIFSVLRGNKGPLDIALFLASGIVLFTLFNDIAIRSLKAMSANEALFFYRPVKPVDTVISRTLVECGLYSLVYLVIIGAIFLVRERWMLNDPPLLMISFLGLATTGFGLGLLLMVAGHRYPSLNQLAPLAMRPLWFISGVFFSPSSLPQWLAPWITWNPVLQAIELSRHAFSEDYVLSEAISLQYLLAWAGVSCCIGLWAYSNNERILLTR
jgi:capsular polysaccharide transport system permease protein